MTRPPERVQRRVAVILGAGGSGRDLLDLVLPLLRRDGAVEMHGVFLEEAEIRHAAELPFVKELCRVTFSVREFTSDQFERALALRIRTAERAISVLARRAGVTHSFRNVRGPAISLLRDTAMTSDVMVFEPASRIALRMSPTPRGRLQRRRIVVALDDIESGSGALRAAGRLADRDAGRIVVLVSGQAAGDQQELWRLCQKLLAGLPAKIRFLPPDRGLGALIEAVHLEGAGLLVMPATSDLLEAPNLQLLRERLRCPICLVRDWAESDQP